uniref:Sirtuin 3 n=1 Tax=Leptobrachium leishanense TaxID=445787 RepID=A0A8C5PDZ5_9ANUR
MAPQCIHSTKTSYLLCIELCMSRHVFVHRGGMPLVSCAQSLRQIMLCCTARSVAGRGVHAVCRAAGLSSHHEKVSSAAPHSINTHRFLHRSQVLCWSFLPSKGGNDKIAPLTLEDIAIGIKEGTYRRILVMVGAGISTDSGIPDFRTPNEGLYSRLQKYNLPYPQAIFELKYFLKDPHAFLDLSKELLPGRHLPNTAHHFLRLLYDKKLLMRLYTQNIDGLERAVGIPLEKLVEAHGSFYSSTCIKCLKTYPGKIFQVEPFASLVYDVKAAVPRVLINREAVGPFLTGHQGLNVSELGEVSAGVKRFAQLLGWDRELSEMGKKEKIAAVCQPLTYRWPSDYSFWITHLYLTWIPLCPVYCLLQPCIHHPSTHTVCSCILGSSLGAISDRS